MLSEACGSRIAVFDINMGCPAPKITGNGEGCALMKDPALAKRLIKTAVAASKIPVTVKFRKGWDESSVNAVDFARMAEQAGASAVAVHGRTRQQYYSGAADPHIIAAVKAAVRIPVIGNGDVFSAHDAARMLTHTGCDAVMVARGALGNPFIFREIKSFLDTGTVLPPPTPEEKAKMLLMQARLCCGYKGEALAMLQMRKHAAWYFKGMHGAAKLREKAVCLQTLDDLVFLLSPFINDL
jgi:tRNA-dihydrouridine synthase B